MFLIAKYCITEIVEKYICVLMLDTVHLGSCCLCQGLVGVLHWLLVFIGFGSGVKLLGNDAPHFTYSTIYSISPFHLSILLFSQSFGLLRICCLSVLSPSHSQYFSRTTWVRVFGPHHLHHSYILFYILFFIHWDIHTHIHSPLKKWTREEEGVHYLLMRVELHNVTSWVIEAGTDN